MIKCPEIKKAFELALPSSIAYFFLGIVFGILFYNMGFSWYLAPIMSAMVYGGSVQFVALGMMHQHSAIISIFFATLFLALRNSFYGLSFIERYNFSWFTKIFMMHTMVDANYAILSTHAVDNKLNDKKFCVWLSLFLYLSWVIGTFIGAFFAGWLPNFSAMGFILPCFFMVIAIENYLANRTLWMILFPIIITAISYWIFKENYFLIAIISSIIFILCIHQSKDKRIVQ